MAVPLRQLAAEVLRLERLVVRLLGSGAAGLVELVVQVSVLEWRLLSPFSVRLVAVVVVASRRAAPHWLVEPAVLVRHGG